MDVGAMIRQAREARGLTQRELALAAGVSQPQLARLEGGRGSPAWATVVRVLAGCGVQLSTRLVPLARTELVPLTGTAEERLWAAGASFDAMLALGLFRKATDAIIVGPSALAIHGVPVNVPELHVAFPDLDGRLYEIVDALWMAGCDGGEWEDVPEALVTLPHSGPAGVRLGVRAGGLVVHAMREVSWATVDFQGTPLGVVDLATALADLDPDVAGSYAPALAACALPAAGAPLGE